MFACMYVSMHVCAQRGRDGGREVEKEVIGFHPSITHVVEF